MARTKGAINKPKYIAVSLETLNKTFNPSTVIMVSVDYSSILGGCPVANHKPLNTEVINDDSEDDKIEMTIS